MLKVLANPLPGLAPEAVSRLEAKLELSLPNDYRDFIQKHNGGQPYPAWILADPQGPIKIDSFDTFSDSPEYLMSVKHFSNMGHAGDFLPIAECGASRYCLRCGAGLGGVYYFNGHADQFEDPFRREVSGFSGLLKMLAYLPEESPWLDYLVTKDYESLKGWLSGFDPGTEFELAIPPIEEATTLRDTRAVELMLAHGHDSAMALGLAENYGFDDVASLIRAHLASHPEAAPRGKSWWQFWK